MDEIAVIAWFIEVGHAMSMLVLIVLPIAVAVLVLRHRGRRSGPVTVQAPEPRRHTTLRVVHRGGQCVHRGRR